MRQLRDRRPFQGEGLISIPIEYFITSSRLQAVLRILEKEPILGLDVVLSPAEPYHSVYWLLAILHRVYVIEKVSASALFPIQDNPNVIKVMA